MPLMSTLGHSNRTGTNTSQNQPRVSVPPAALENRPSDYSSGVQWQEVKIRSQQPPSRIIIAVWDVARSRVRSGKLEPCSVV